MTIIFCVEMHLSYYSVAALSFIGLEKGNKNNVPLSRGGYFQRISPSILIRVFRGLQKIVFPSREGDIFREFHDAKYQHQMALTTLQQKQQKS